MELIDGGLNGWKVGDFFCSRDCQHMGAVLRVHEWGIEVLWDDDKVGHLVFDTAAPNNIDTVKKIGMAHNMSLRDFFKTPYESLWKAVHDHAHLDTFPHHPYSVRTTGSRIHAL